MSICFINLSAGLLQNRYKGEFIRIQSSLLESHQFNRLFYGLSDNLLFNLARGNECVIIDCSSNSIGKVIKQGIPIISMVLNKYWYGIIDKKILGFVYIKRICNSLSQPTKNKIKYYKKFSSHYPIKLKGISIHIDKELSTSHNEQR